MLALEIYLNSERVCVAGIQGNGVVSAILSSITRPEKSWSELDVGGLSHRNEHVRWVDRELAVGDEVRIKVVDAASADEPVERQSVQA